jgi:RNA polymerase sigma-70 factor (ECF subfamily)
MTSVADADVLFAEHRQGVFRYLCRIVGHVETAQDLTQEVFLRVARSQVPDDNASGRRAWVFTIARNLALNHLRDGRRQSSVVSRQSVELIGAAEPAVQELAAAIQQALTALQDLDRDVFLLRESAGLSYDEIAVACDLTVEAVRARLRRARQELRASLDGPMRIRRQRRVSFGGGDHE